MASAVYVAPPTYLPSRRGHFHIWVRNLLMNSAPYPLPTYPFPADATLPYLACVPNPGRVSAEGVQNTTSDATRAARPGVGHDQRHSACPRAAFASPRRHSVLSGAASSLTHATPRMSERRHVTPTPLRTCRSGVASSRHHSALTGVASDDATPLCHARVASMSRACRGFGRQSISFKPEWNFAAPPIELG